jgi:monoamine oxidase
MTDTISRREALRRAGQATALATLGPGVLAACGASTAPAAEVDVAIIGGGPSGLYAAYRLLTGTSGKGGKPSVAVFEASGRLGGRIWSVVPAGAPHLIAEFGGMRFLKTQAIVPRLVKALNLRFVPFSAGNGQNLYYLRAHRFRASQLSDPAVVPYALPAGERGMSPADLLLKGIETYVPGAATLTGAEWEQLKKTKTFGGQLLADQGYWNLMQAALGAEGFDFVADGIGYPSDTVNWNAVEQMQADSADFHPGASYFTIPGGYQRLPLTLGALAQRAGAAIHLNHTVRAVTPVSGGRVKLTVQSASGAATTVNTGHVIMAIPLDPMTALVERSPFLQQREFANAMATAGPAPASKSFCTFSKPWWHELGIRGGYSITDLPVKRVWYFGTEGQQPGANPANRTSLLMCYNDLAPAGYWAGYEGAAAFNGPPARRTSPPDLVASAVQQLSEIHGIDVPQPEWSEFINWENLPYGSGFYYWQVHAHSWEVIPYLRRPFDGVGLSVCGDCWSPAQSWIESGLTTTEGLLQSVFGYRPPRWLPEGVGIST